MARYDSTAAKSDIQTMTMRSFSWGSSWGKHAPKSQKRLSGSECYSETHQSISSKLESKYQKIWLVCLFAVAYWFFFTVSNSLSVCLFASVCLSVCLFLQVNRELTVVCSVNGLGRNIARTLSRQQLTFWRPSFDYPFGLLLAYHPSLVDVILQLYNKSIIRY